MAITWSTAKMRSAPLVDTSRGSFLTHGLSVPNIAQRKVGLHEHQIVGMVRWDGWIWLRAQLQCFSIDHLEWKEMKRIRFLFSEKHIKPTNHPRSQLEGRTVRPQYGKLKNTQRIAGNCASLGFEDGRQSYFSSRMSCCNKDQHYLMGVHLHHAKPVFCFERPFNLQGALHWCWLQKQPKFSRIRRILAGKWGCTFTCCSQKPTIIAELSLKWGFASCSMLFWFWSVAPSRIVSSSCFFSLNHWISLALLRGLAAVSRLPLDLAGLALGIGFGGLTTRH